MRVCPITAVLAVSLAAVAPPSWSAAAEPSSTEELAAARKLFEANLEAIRNRDRQAYLACYLDSPDMVRTGPEGLQRGFRAHAEQSTESSWPDSFEALDLQLVPVRSGMVYGTYRYRVSYGDKESSGISERIFLRTPQGWRIAMTSAFPSPAGTPPPPRALVGATLVDGSGSSPVANAVVVLRGGKIACAGSRVACPVPEGIETLNLSGFWITPGLIDAHVHFCQTGWADGRPDALDVRDRYPYEDVQAQLRANPQRWLRSYLCSGVTAVFDVGGYPWTWSLRELTERDTFAPRVAAAGPLLSTRDHWLNLPAERQFIHLVDEKAAREGVRYLASHKASAAKVWFIIVPDRPFAELEAAVLAAGEEARKLGLRLIVHATGLQEAKSALKAGARLLVHSVWDKPVDQEFLDLARRNKTIYCPTLTVASGYRRMFEAAAAGQGPRVDDPHGCVDSQTLDRIAETAVVGGKGITQQDLDRRAARVEEQSRVMAANLKAVHDAGIAVAMGTDAGNPLTLHGPSVHSEMETMQAAGLTPMQVLVASTRGGALAMGREDDLGLVKAGMAADLLVLAADPTASASSFRKAAFVVRGGEIRAVEELASRPLTP